MATIDSIIIPIKVLKNGMHKLRVAVHHELRISYIVTNIILADPSQFKNGKIVKHSKLSTMNKEFHSLRKTFVRII